MDTNGTNELDAPAAPPAAVDAVMSSTSEPVVSAEPVVSGSDEPVGRVIVPDSSPEQQRVIAALPPSRLDGHKEVDDFEGISMHFAGRSTGMGKSNSNDSATAPVKVVVEPMDEDQPRKRIRRGPIRYEDGGSTVASSQQSAVTSPAESDHSSAPAITSPADEPDSEAPATLSIRDHLSQFKVDSAPSSAASSAYGGSSSNLKDLQSQPVVGGRKPSELQESMTIDSSSPVAKPFNRLVRGKRPEAQVPAPLGSIDLRSPTQPTPAPFLTSSSIPAIPPFNPAGGSRAPAPPPPRQPLVIRPPPANPPVQPSNATFEQFVAMVPKIFTEPQLRAAWHESGENLHEAFKMLVQVKQALEAQGVNMDRRGGGTGVYQPPSQQQPHPYPPPPQHFIPAYGQPGYGQQHVSPQVRQQFPPNPLQQMSPQPAFLQYPQGQRGSPGGVPQLAQYQGQGQGPPISVQDMRHRQLYEQNMLQQQAYQQQQQQRARQTAQRFPVGQIPPHQRPKASTSQASPPKQSLMARTMANQYQLPPTNKKRKKVQHSDSDGDGGEYSDGSADEYGGVPPVVQARRDALALEFFNTETRENICELAGCNPTQATLVIKLRPFTSTNDFRARTRKQKGVGNMLMDTYNGVIEGMIEVDKLLSDCEQIGVDLSKIMKIWAGASSDPASASGGDQDVGMNLVDIPAAEVLKQAEESTDPEVKAAFSGYLRKQPEGVPDKIKLKDYQMLGVNWLNLLYSRNTSCILADEMGLGKTAQVIALMSHLKSNGEKGPHLVIVPSSTLENWMREFSVFAPGLIVASYYGSQADRAELRYELKAMEELDVVVTTYNIATSSIDDQKFLKKKLAFKIAVFDEGHQLKNSESKKYKDLMQIKAQWRLLLTGTPLQNNLQELVSLLSFILPNQFRDANESLRAIFKVGPGSQANLLSVERINRAKKMMTPFVLRRKKAQVLKDLPKKIETVEWCEMTDLQQEVYIEAMNRSRAALSGVEEADIEQLGAEEDAVDEDAPKKKGKAQKSSTKNGKMSDGNSGSNVLMDLRKASNHPMLFRRLYNDKVIRTMSKDCLKELDFADRDQDIIFEDMQVMTDFELHRFAMGYKHLKKYCLTNDEWMSAGKIQALMRLLPELKKNGHRVLLFSQFTQILDILEVVLGTMGLRYLKLTGQTPVTERQGLVDEYSNDPEITVFLLSTRAGGLGLNLTSANTVIFYDQDYNPQNDLQAEDRAYRIGQTRDVTIIKLLAKGTIDEDMHRLGAHKLLLDSSVSSTTQYPANVVTADEPTVGGEKKMRTSLLNNLKKNFGKSDAPGGSQVSPKKEPISSVKEESKEEAKEEVKAE